jgi:hypothetical protein
MPWQTRTWEPSSAVCAARGHTTGPLSCADGDLAKDHAVPVRISSRPSLARVRTSAKISRTSRQPTAAGPAPGSGYPPTCTRRTVSANLPTAQASSPESDRINRHCGSPPGTAEPRSRAEKRVMQACTFMLWSGRRQPPPRVQVQPLSHCPGRRQGGCLDETVADSSCSARHEPRSPR